MSTKIRNILFALIFICCVSIAGNIIQGFYLPGQAVASFKSEELTGSCKGMSEKTSGRV